MLTHNVKLRKCILCSHFECCCIFILWTYTSGLLGPPSLLCSVPGGTVAGACIA